MDTILSVMILLTPLTSMCAFIYSQYRGTGPSPEDNARDGMPASDQEAVSALNRIRKIILTPEEWNRLKTAEDYR